MAVKALVLLGLHFDRALSLAKRFRLKLGIASGGNPGHALTVYGRV